VKTLLLAALLTATPRTEPPCITPAEITDALLFILPALIDGTAEKCRAALPAEAYLFVGARSLGERLKAESKVHYAGAVSAFEKMAKEKLPRGLSEATVSGLIAEGMRGELLADMKSSQCADINQTAELLAPLPPENLGGLATLLIRLGLGQDKNRAKGRDAQICTVAR
jgi:hypothetical protein